MVHDLRAMCDAVAYVVRNGIEWRALPVDFRPHAAERTFGWLMRYHRLVRDYERRTDHHEAMVCWAVLIMTKRLARYETGQPPPRRWGGDRKPPGEREPQEAEQAA